MNGKTFQINFKDIFHLIVVPGQCHYIPQYLEGMVLHSNSTTTCCLLWRYNDSKVLLLDIQKIVSFGFSAKEVVLLLLLSSIRVVIRMDRRNHYSFGNAVAAATAQGARVPYVKVKE